jgi:hypothetical protein
MHVNPTRIRRLDDPLSGWNWLKKRQHSVSNATVRGGRTVAFRGCLGIADLGGHFGRAGRVCWFCCLISGSIDPSR